MAILHSPLLKLPVWILLAGLVLLLLPAQVSAATVIAVEERATPLSAHAGRLVWSSYDPAIGRYRLVTRFGGVTSRVPIRTSRFAVSADLGPDRRGRTVVVYPRCRPRVGCDLFQFDFASGREVKLDGPSSPYASETNPSIWKGRIAFVRIYHRRAGVRGVLPQIYVRDLHRGARSRAVRGGTRGVYERICPRSPCSRYEVFDGGRGLTALELHGRNLAFTWQHRPSTCNGDEEANFIRREELWLARIGGTRRRLALGDCHGSSYDLLTSPSFSGGRLFWGEDQRRFRRLDLRTAERSAAQVPATVTWIERDGADTYFARILPNTVQRTEIVEADPILFAPG